MNEIEWNSIMMVIFLKVHISLDIRVPYIYIYVCVCVYICQFKV